MKNDLEVLIARNVGLRWGVASDKERTQSSLARTEAAVFFRDHPREPARKGPAPETGPENDCGRSRDR